MMSKIDVNGDAAPTRCTSGSPRSARPAGHQGIKWNFTKFLVGKDGR
jgi:glutathione peroxidase